MRFPKTEYAIALGRHLVSLSWNMPTLRRSCSCPLYVVRLSIQRDTVLTTSSQYKTRLNKQEARSFHRPALQFPSNVELRFNKVRSAKKKKDKAGRKVGKGGNVSEGLYKTADLSLKDTSNYVLLEYSVRPWVDSGRVGLLTPRFSFRKNTLQYCQTSVWAASSSTTIERRAIRTSTFQRCGSLYAGHFRPLTNQHSLTSVSHSCLNPKTNLRS